KFHRARTKLHRARTKLHRARTKFHRARTKLHRARTKLHRARTMAGCQGVVSVILIVLTLLVISYAAISANWADTKLVDKYIEHEGLFFRCPKFGDCVNVSEEKNARKFATFLFWALAFSLNTMTLVQLLSLCITLLRQNRIFALVYILEAVAGLVILAVYPTLITVPEKTGFREVSLGYGYYAMCVGTVLLGATAGQCLSIDDKSYPSI
ncbi:unnamed protein product, partial [Lymnaea stagnalis]